MRIKYDYFTLEQLSEKWELSTNDIIHLGLTDQIEFTALTDREYPSGYVQCGVEIPISVDWLHNLIYGQKSFVCELTLKESSVKISNNAIEERFPSILTFYPETSRLVITNDEVEKFENKFDVTGRGQLLNSNRSDNLRTLMLASEKFWANADRDDSTTWPYNEQIEEWLKKQGFSNRQASAGATMIRPEWAPAGRRPEK